MRYLTTKEEWDAALANAGDRLVVIDFTATWCGPCKLIGPQYEVSTGGPQIWARQLLPATRTFVLLTEIAVCQLLLVHTTPFSDNLSQALEPRIPNVECYKVDVDDAEELTAMNDIASMPTFKFFRRAEELAVLTGSDFGKLKAKVNHSVPSLFRCTALYRDSHGTGRF